MQEEVFRCRKCKCFINNRFNVKDEEKGKVKKSFLICNLCATHNELTEKIPGVKSEYFYNDTSSIIELNFPTVDFKLHKLQDKQSEKMNHQFYVFIIDISEFASKFNFSQYVINF